MGQDHSHQDFHHVSSAKPAAAHVVSSESTTARDTSFVVVSPDSPHAVWRSM